MPVEEREIPELVDLKALLSSCRWSIREFRLSVIRENSPDLFCVISSISLSFRMGLIADKNIKAVTDELVRLERKRENNIG